MFAIVDIETNGKPATGANITEIAVILHNGQKEFGRWERLIKPEAPMAVAAALPPKNRRLETLCDIVNSLSQTS